MIWLVAANICWWLNYCACFTQQTFTVVRWDLLITSHSFVFQFIRCVFIWKRLMFFVCELPLLWSCSKTKSSFLHDSYALQSFIVLDFSEHKNTPKYETHCLSLILLYPQHFSYMSILLSQNYFQNIAYFWLLSMLVDGNN